jgi:hypothetical protein
VTMRPPRRPGKWSVPPLIWWQALIIFATLTALMLGVLWLVSDFTAATLAALLHVRLSTLETGGIGGLAAALAAGYAFVSVRGRDEVTQRRTSTGASWRMLGLILFGSASIPVLVAALLAKL